MGFIYRLTFPSKKSYIGQTIRTIEERFQAHQYASSNCVAVYNAIQKYGWEKVEKEWYEISDEDLNFYEEMLVALLGTLSPGGYNLKEGGGNGRPSEETKQKMKEAQTGEKNHMFGKEHTEETKQKIGEALAGEKNPMFGKTGEKHPMFGKEHTEETKQKIGEALAGEKNPMFGKTGEKNPMYGKEHTKESKKKMSKAQIGEKNHASKRVYQYTLDGMYVDSFGSIEKAAQSLGKTNTSGISRCANPNCKRKSAYGFKWSFTEL